MKANSICGTIYFTSAKKKKQGVGEELERGRPMGVHQACEVIHHMCHGEQSQSWDCKGKWCWELRALCHLPPHGFTSHTTLLHNTHTGGLISQHTNDEPCHGYTHTIQSQSHSKATQKVPAAKHSTLLCSKTGHTVLQL